jgi:hypothetical protein
MAEPGGGGVRMNRIGGWEVWSWRWREQRPCGSLPAAASAESRGSRAASICPWRTSHSQSQSLTACSCSSIHVVAGAARQDSKVTRGRLLGAEGGPVAGGIPVEPENCGGLRRSAGGSWRRGARPCIHGHGSDGGEELLRAVAGHRAAHQPHKLRPSGGAGVVCSELRGRAAAGILAGGAGVGAGAGGRPAVRAVRAGRRQEHGDGGS